MAVRKLRRWSMLLLLLAIWPSASEAAITATFVDGGFSAVGTPGGDLQYDFATVTVFINPAVTNWVAWNDTATVSRTDGSFPGQFFLWGGGGFGTDDFIRLTVTNPSAAVLTVDLDHNNAFGAHVLTDPMQVIFGTAAAAPDALRIDAFGSTAGTKRVFNEGGAFNSIFTTAGNYKFDFSFRDRFAGGQGHSNVFLLVDTVPTNGVPEPSSLALFGGLGAIVVARRLRRKHL